ADGPRTSSRFVAATVSNRPGRRDRAGERFAFSQLVLSHRRRERRFFSVFPVGQKAAGVLICDVMGHGVRSALITGMIRGLVEEHARLAADPGELLTRINRALTMILKQAGTTMFATCFYVVADVQRGELRFANAGHPSALHVRRSGTAAEKLDGQDTRGPAMGIFASVNYPTST